MIQIGQTISFHSSSIKQRAPIRKSPKRTKILGEVNKTSTKKRKKTRSQIDGDTNWL